MPTYDMYYASSGFPSLFRGTFQFSAIIGILSVVALWFVFKKANEEGWAAVIPVYNLYVLFKITWGSGWKFLLLLIPIANIVIYIITMVKLAKVFGKGGGWACGLIFLYPIFICIMAFDKSIVYMGEFAGNTGAQGSATPYASATGYDTINTNSDTPQVAPQYQPTSSPSFCSSCGAPINKGDKFCINCGNQI